MGKRLSIAVGLLATGGIGIYMAFAFSRLIPNETAMGESYTYHLFYKPAAWLIPLGAFLGVFFRALFKYSEKGTKFKEGKIMRHDEHMFFSHWTVAVSVLILAVSGFDMGPGFLSRLVHTPEATGFALNQHFIGIIFFVFGLSYAISDFAIKGSLREHLPGVHDLKDTLSYYTSKLSGAEPPKQGKFLASEKLTFPVWIILLGGITLTGGIKVAAHIWTLPAALMPPMTFIHDVCALCLLALLAAHVLLGAIVPWSWPLIRSMVTGYMTEDHVRKEHRLWYEEIQSETKG